MAQLHKKFSDNQIKDLLGRCIEKKIKRIDVQKVLKSYYIKSFTVF